MEPLDCYAGGPHFRDHLTPVVRALEPCERGRFHLTAWARRGASGDDIPWSSRPVDRNKRAPILLASWGDVPKIGGRNFCMIEHGSGQKYGPDIAPGTTPCWDDPSKLVLLLAPNEVVAERNRMHHPRAVSVAVGSARVDRLRKIREETRDSIEVGTHITGRETFDAPGRTTDRTLPTVAFTTHWSPKGDGLPPESRSAWTHWKAAVAQLAAIGDVNRGYRMLGTAHPRAYPEVRRTYHRAGIPHTPDFDNVIREADVLVADNSSAMWEAAACGVRLVLLDCPLYRKHVEHGLRFWSAADAGLRVGSGRADELHAAILTTLADDPCAARREEVAFEVYGVADGMAAQRSAEAIRSVLHAIAT